MVVVKKVDVAIAGSTKSGSTATRISAVTKKAATKKVVNMVSMEVTV